MSRLDFIIGLRRADGALRRGLDMNIGDLFSALAARWRLFLVILPITLGLAGLYMVVTPKRYAAFMSFLVDTRERAPLGADPAPTQQNPDASLVDNQMRLLMSNTVLRRVVNDEKLMTDPEFGGAKSGGLGAWVKKTFLSSANVVTQPSVDQITEALAKSITVKRSDKSYVIDVEVRASSAAKAEQLAKALAKAFLDTQTQLMDVVAEKESKWLDEKIVDLRSRLQEAETQAQKYRTDNKIVVSGGLTPSEQQLKAADDAVVLARAKRAEAEALYKQMLNAGRGGVAPAANDALRSGLLEKLRTDYASLARDAATTQSTFGPRHPAMVVIQSQLNAQRLLIDREIARVLEAQRNELRAARDVESAAEAQVASLKNTINASGLSRNGLDELERQAAALRDNYQKALAARENTHAQAISSPNPVLINQVIAQTLPVSPKATGAMIIAVVGAINIWIVAALLLEFSSKQKAAPAPPAAQKQAAGASLARTPVLVALPALDDEFLDAAPNDKRESTTLSRAIAAMEAEDSPYRIATARIWRDLQHRLRSGSQPVVAVAALTPNAGGSTLTLALAIEACDRGERVLAIDCNGDHATLSALLAHLSSVSEDSAAPFKMFLCRRDKSSGGEILLSRLKEGDPPPDRKFLAEWFDLVLLDCGAHASPDLPIDGLILLERDPRDGQRRARLSFHESEICHESQTRELEAA